MLFPSLLFLPFLFVITPRLEGFPVIGVLFCYFYFHIFKNKPIRQEQMGLIGKHHQMKVTKWVDFGIYLDGGEDVEILLPNKFVPAGTKVGDTLNVFVYVDAKGRPIATTETPLACVGDFAYLKAVSVSPVGAFLDWGLTKDLLVPFAEQKQKMIEGHHYLVYIYFDAVSSRIVASAKLSKFINKHPSGYKAGQEVSLLISGRSDLGYNAIVDNHYTGVLYSNELYQSVKPGMKVTGYIKKVREDGKLDLSLQKYGYEKVKDFTDTVLERLRAAGGFLPLTDSSEPEKISEMFGVSKKTFKKTIGVLYKERKILIEENGIRLTEELNQ